MILAAETISKIPVKLRPKDNNKNLCGFMCEIPMRLTPISSGKGEAIISAPITGSVQLKYFVFKM